MQLTEELKQEYLDLWQSCTIKPNFQDELNDSVATIANNEASYKDIAHETGVPWYVVAIIHGLEASFNFKTHLHNGDPLDKRTIQEPAGRPRLGMPPFTWKKSAIDALNFDGATGIQSWDLPTTFWYLEGYNGWGYRTGAGRATEPRNRSPYIYSGTTHYNKGKYGSDGHFDPNLVSDQVGCMALLFGLVSARLINLDSSIVQTIENDPNRLGSITAWQNILNGCGYVPTLSITGELDESTKKVTTKFQNDLNIVVQDVEIGTLTLATWQAGLNHRKLVGWSNITPQISPKSNLVLSNSSRRITQTLYEFYSDRNHYQAVFDNVMVWFGTTSNGCVAFMSTALRLSGALNIVPMPPSDDGGISLLTLDFSNFLEEENWARFTDWNLLEDGDIVFTKVGEDDPTPNEGFPAHTFMFAGWSDRDNNIALVIDNQDFIHERNILGSGSGFNFTPFEYFLRK